MARVVYVGVRAWLRTDGVWVAHGEREIDAPGDTRIRKEANGSTWQEAVEKALDSLGVLA